MLKERKGITLIALVITIIVLLILAGIALNAIMGEDGIISKAEQSKISTRIGDIKETADLIKAEYKTNTLYENPTSRYTIEKLILQGKVEESEVVDYGDYSGVGIIKIKDNYIYINGSVDGMALGYEIIQEPGITTIRFYPKLEGSDTYCDYASQILYGKSDSELEALFVEGWNYWAEEEPDPYYASSFNDIAQYYYEQGLCDTVCTDLDEFANIDFFRNARDMLCGRAAVKPFEFDWSKEEVSKEFSLYDITNDFWILDMMSTSEYYLEEYRVVQSGTYSFVLIDETTGEEVIVDIYIEVKGEIDLANAFITDGEGTLLDFKDEFYIVSDRWPNDCWNYTLISTIKIPEKIGDETITAIGNNVFAYLYGLKSVEMPDTITSIGYSAFYNCSDIETIKLSKNITFIGNNAFQDCVSLKNIVIPNGVTTIPHYAFNGCSSLESVSIPDTVTTIVRGAFSGCRSLKEITIPNSVTTMENYAFQYCTSLESITLSNALTTIEGYTFQNCTALKSIIIPDGITSIGNWAFYSCKALTSVVIPTSLKTIGTQTFYDCISITDVYYKGTTEEWSSISKGGYNYNLTDANITYNYIIE